MSVFLTPELKPFVGGTYFPPADSFGRPGFPTILKAIAEQVYTPKYTNALVNSTHILKHTQWKTDHERIRQQGSKIIDVLSQAIAVSPSDDSLPGTGCVQRGYEMLEKKFDSEYGGFGSTPKFPQPGVCVYLYVCLFVCVCTRLCMCVCIVCFRVAILNFLLGVYSRYIGSPMGERALETVLFTLRAMAKGGMHDHVGQVGGCGNQRS